MTSLDADLPIADSAINPSDAASGADSEVDWGEERPTQAVCFLTPVRIAKGRLPKRRSTAVVHVRLDWSL